MYVHLPQRARQPPQSPSAGIRPAGPALLPPPTRPTTLEIHDWTSRRQEIEVKSYEQGVKVAIQNLQGGASNTQKRRLRSLRAQLHSFETRPGAVPRQFHGSPFVNGEKIHHGDTLEQAIAKLGVRNFYIDEAVKRPKRSFAVAEATEVRLDRSFRVLAVGFHSLASNVQHRYVTAKKSPEEIKVWLRNVPKVTATTRGVRANNPGVGRELLKLKIPPSREKFVLERGRAPKDRGGYDLIAYRAYEGEAPITIFLSTTGVVGMEDWSEEL